MISSFYLIIIFILGVLFFASAVGALVWASKSGQFQDFERGSRTIFDEEEPEGVMQDSFPGKSKKRAVRANRTGRGKTRGHHPIR